MAHKGTQFSLMRMTTPALDQSRIQEPLMKMKTPVLDQSRIQEQCTLHFPIGTPATQRFQTLTEPSQHSFQQSRTSSLTNQSIHGYQSSPVVVNSFPVDVDEHCSINQIDQLTKRPITFHSEKINCTLFTPVCSAVVNNSFLSTTTNVDSSGSSLQKTLVSQQSQCFDALLPVNEKSNILESSVESNKPEQAPINYSFNTEVKVSSKSEKRNTEKFFHERKQEFVQTGISESTFNKKRHNCFSEDIAEEIEPGTSKQTNSSHQKIEKRSEPALKKAKLSKELPSKTKVAEELDALRFEYPWLACDDLPEVLADDNYFPSGEIAPNCDSDPGMEGFDEHIVNFMKEQKIPGLSLCISRKHAIIYTQCYGWATKAKRLEPSHMFRIASVSKVLTAIGILHLCDMGKLRIANKVFGEKGVFTEMGPSKTGDRRVYSITIKNLLQHSGGWDREVAGDAVYYTATEMGMKPGIVDPWSLVEYMLSQKLQFAPGSRYAYSNFGYLLLGLIIERVSGVSYEKYVGGLMDACSLRGMVLGTTKHEDKHPLEVDYFSGPGARVVDSVFPGEDKVDAAYGHFCLENAKAFGGWVATPTHLVRLLHELELGHILKPSVVRKMKMKPDFCKELLWYGLGLDVQFNGKHYEHSGMIDGATSILTHSRDGYTWAVCCNYWPADVDYNSVVQYGLCLVKGWTRLTPFITPQFHGATHLGMYTFCVQLSHAEFLQKTKFCFKEGYRIHYINSYVYQGTLLFNVIWVIDGKDGRFLMDIEAEKTKCIIEKQKVNGFVPTHVELYEKNDKLMCCIIFMKSVKNVEFILHNRVNKVEEEISHMLEKKWVPNVVCVCLKGGQQWVASLYHKSTDRNWVKIGMTKDVYQKNLAKQSRIGHMPIYVRIHQGDKVPLYTAIWSNPGPYIYTTDFEMSKFRLLCDFVTLENEDFLPHCISGYESEATHKYVAVFVKAAHHKTLQLPKSSRGKTKKISSRSDSKIVCN